MRRSLSPTDVIAGMMMLAGLLLLAGQSWASDPGAAHPTQVAQAQPEADHDSSTARNETDDRLVRWVGASDPSASPTYRPPMRGAPREKVSRGVRGSLWDYPTPQALAPTHVAQTSSAAPSLYWYLDRVPERDVVVEFTLIDDDSDLPLAQFNLPVPSRAGIQPIHLAEQGVALPTGVDYEWSVALIVDPDQRSQDIIANGFIRRVNSSAEGVVEFAESGLWYDALAAISDEIDARPDAPRLHEVRRALLSQAGLNDL